MNDTQFRRLLEEHRLSWKGYRKVRGGVKKRIRRHMLQLKCNNLSEYLNVLDASDEMRSECDRLLTVSISRFFRDRKVWEILETEILPKLVDERKDLVKVWSAGCARGEEVYSFKILWNHLAETVEKMPMLKLLATDLNAEYLEKAQIGRYNPSSLREVSDDDRNAWFDEVEQGQYYSIKRKLKYGITWKRLSLPGDPPMKDVDLLFLRNNVLTYYEGARKRDAFTRVIDCLGANGYLITGSHETLPRTDVVLQKHESCPCIFRKLVQK